MKVAKNMDSVFADCTQDELDFEAFFDHDDCLIDMVAGVDEAGNLLTGEDYDIDALVARCEAEEMVGENPDGDYQKDGDAAYDLKDAEGTKDVKPEIGGEVGDGKEVSGKENSAESNADDVKDEEEAIGANDKQQTALESAPDVDTLKEDSAEGPLEDDDEAERDGEVPAGTVETEAAEEDTCPECGNPLTGCTCNLEGCKEAFDAVAAKISSINEYTLGDMLDDSSKEALTHAATVAASKGKDKTGIIAAVKNAYSKLPDKVKKGLKPAAAAAAIAAAVAAGMAIAKKKKDAKAKAAEEADKKQEEQSTNESIDMLADNILESVLNGDMDIDSLLSESDDPIEDKCDCGERSGEIKHDTSEVEGKDAEPIGAAVDGINKDDVLEDEDDVDMRDGSADRDTKDVEGVKAPVVESAPDVDTLEEELDITLEEEYDIEIEDDEIRDGEVKRDTSEVEGKDAEPIGAAVDGINKDDALEDQDDAEQREGKADTDTKDVEGVKTPVVESTEELDITLEADDSIDDVVDKVSDGDGDISAVDGADDTVPDKDVQVAGTSNDIDPDRDTVYEGLAGEILAMLEAEESAEKAVSEEEDEGDEDDLIELADKLEKLDDVDTDDYDLEADYDDDELIDMVASGDVDDIDLDDID